MIDHSHYMFPKAHRDGASGSITDSLDEADRLGYLLNVKFERLIGREDMHAEESYDA